MIGRCRGSRSILNADTASIQLTDLHAAGTRWRGESVALAVDGSGEVVGVELLTLNFCRWHHSGLVDAWPSTHVGHELIAAGMLIVAGGRHDTPLDYDELERWTRVGLSGG